MSLATLIQGKKDSIALQSATATPATVPINAGELMPSVATIANVAVATLVPDFNLWGWFVLEADRVYRSSTNSTDRWSQHKVHRKIANDLYKTGNMAEAKVELEKALTALR